MPAKARRRRKTTAIEALAEGAWERRVATGETPIEADAAASMSHHLARVADLLSFESTSPATHARLAGFVRRLRTTWERVHPEDIDALHSDRRLRLRSLVDKWSRKGSKLGARATACRYQICQRLGGEWHRVTYELVRDAVASWRSRGVKSQKWPAMNALANAIECGVPIDADNLRTWYARQR